MLSGSAILDRAIYRLYGGSFSAATARNSVWFFGKAKKTKIVLHVQDLQPDAAVDLGMLKPGKLTALLFKVERCGYALATRVSTISGAMRKKIESKGVPRDKCLIFKNWANDDLILPLDTTESLRDEWSLHDRFVVLYSGNMGVKQGLGMMLDAAALLRKQEDVLFLIVGNGGEKEALVARAQREGLSNVRFTPPVQIKHLGRLLAAADISVITQKAGIDDLVLPSKLGNLLCSQRPVIAATTADSELASIIEEAACGVVIAPEDGMALAQSIEALMTDPAGRLKMATNGRSYALANLASKAILKQFERDLLAIAS